MYSNGENARYIGRDSEGRGKTQREWRDGKIQRGGEERERDRQTDRQLGR